VHICQQLPAQLVLLPAVATCPARTAAAGAGSTNSALVPPALWGHAEFTCTDAGQAMPTHAVGCRRSQMLMLLLGVRRQQLQKGCVEQAACMHLSLHACSCGVLGSGIGVASWHCDDGKQLIGTGRMGVTGRPAVHACAHHSSRFSLLLLRRRRAGSTPQCLKPAPSVHIMYRAVAIGWSALHPDGAETTHRACLLVSSGKKSTGSFSGDVFPALLVVWF
jgi:hypothetical protein